MEEWKKLRGACSNVPTGNKQTYMDPIFQTVTGAPAAPASVTTYRSVNIGLDTFQTLRVHGSGPVFACGRALYCFSRVTVSWYSFSRRAFSSAMNFFAAGMKAS